MSKKQNGRSLEDIMNSVKSAPRRKFKNYQTVTWIRGKKNPFIKDGPRFYRTEIVRRNSGCTVGYFRRMSVMKQTTVNTLFKLGLVKVA